MISPRYVNLVGILALAAVLVGGPLVLSKYYLFVLTEVLILAIFAIAFDLVFGYAGLLSFGHAAFFGLGGYALAMGTTRWGWSWSTSIAVGMAVGGVVGAAFMLIGARTRGTYFLLTTLALAQSIWGLAYSWASISGGDFGITSVPRPRIFGYSTWDSTVLYILVAVLFVASLALLAMIVSSPVGLVLKGTRESETRMRALGYNVLGYRVFAFAVSGALAALSGALSALAVNSVSPASLYWLQSATIIVVAILGGPGTLVGPILGAVVVGAVPILLSPYTLRTTLILGLIFVVTILFARKGLMGVGAEAVLRVGRRRLRRSSEQPPRAERESSKR